MQLIQVEAIEAQPAEAPIELRSETLGTPVLLPLMRPRTVVATLGRDHETFRIRIERLGDQLLADVRSVGFRRVNQVDPQLDGALQRRDRFRTIARRPPDAVAGNAHGAEAKPVNREVSAQKKGAAKHGSGHGHGTKWQSVPLTTVLDGRKSWLHLCSCLSWNGSPWTRSVRNYAPSSSIIFCSEMHRAASHSPMTTPSSSAASSIRRASWSSSSICRSATASTSTTRISFLTIWIR